MLQSSIVQSQRRLVPETSKHSFNNIYSDEYNGWVYTKPSNVISWQRPGVLVIRETWLVGPVSMCRFLSFLVLPNLLGLRKSTHEVSKMMPDKNISCIYSTIPEARWNNLSLCKTRLLR